MILLFAEALLRVRNFLRDVAVKFLAPALPGSSYDGRNKIPSQPANKLP